MKLFFKHPSISIVVALTVFVCIGIWIYTKSGVTSEPNQSNSNESVLSIGTDEKFDSEFTTEINKDTNQQQEPQTDSTDNGTQKHVVDTGNTPFEQDWCIANQDLSSTDLTYLQTVERDWNEQIGLSSIAIPSHIGEGAFTESYRYLPAEELERLALNGDKWAMVTYIQKISVPPNINTKNKVARELLVHGANHYALSYFIRTEFLSAKSVYKQTKDISKASEHLKSALVYVLYSMEVGNAKLLDIFVNMLLTDDVFNDKFELGILLGNHAEGELQQDLEKLKQELDTERKNRQIDLPTLPAAITKKNQMLYARIKYEHPDMANYLENTHNQFKESFKINACMERHLNRFAKLENQSLILK